MGKAGRVALRQAHGKTVDVTVLAGGVVEFVDPALAEKDSPPVGLRFVLATATEDNCKYLCDAVMQRFGPVRGGGFPER